MNQGSKTITYMPVKEIWEGRKLVSDIKRRDVGVADVATLMRSGPVRFVIAGVGKPFEWVPESAGFDFWKTEVKSHLAEPETKVFLEDFPNEYFYFASEWKSFDGEPIILLSKMH